MLTSPQCGRIGIRPLCLAIGIALVSLQPSIGLAAPALPQRPAETTAADSDGDGIADDFDPDDDNDGITDDQEGASGNPGPDILDPGKDTDGDGIANSHDPDDNNNGVTDEEDPSSFPPSNGGGSSSPPAPQAPPTTSQPAASRSGDSGGGSGFLIQTLPDTGSGTAHDAGPHGWSPFAALAGLLTLLAVKGCQPLRTARIHNRRGVDD